MPDQIERFTTINAGDHHPYYGFTREALLTDDGIYDFSPGSRGTDPLDFTTLSPREAAKKVIFVDGATVEEELGFIEKSGIRFAFAPGIQKTEKKGSLLIIPQEEVELYGLEGAIHRGQVESTTYFYGREKELWTKLAEEYPLIVQQMVAYGILGSTAYDRHHSGGFENIAGHNPLVTAVYDEALAACGYSVEERKLFRHKAFGHDVGKRGEVTYYRGQPPEEIARRIIQYHSKYYQDGSGNGFVHDDMERMTGVDLRGIDTKPLEWLALRYADSAVDGSKITPDWRSRIDNLRTREDAKFKEKGGLSATNMVALELYRDSGFLGAHVENYYEDVLKRATAFCEEELFKRLTPEVRREVREPAQLLPYLLNRMSTRPSILKAA